MQKFRAPDPGGGTRALYGRRDARRHNAFAAMSRWKCAPSRRLRDQFAGNGPAEEPFCDWNR